MGHFFRPCGGSQRNLKRPLAVASWLVPFLWLSLLNLEAAPYRAVNLQAEDLLWDASRGHLYASVPSIDTQYSNSVVALDPVSSTVLFSIPVGPVIRPNVSTRDHSGKLALSDDGRYLYVAVSNAVAVQRIDLATQTVGAAFEVGKDQIGRTLSVADMVVLTGKPTSVAIARGNGAAGRGVAIYDHGVRRPATTPDLGWPVIDRLEPSSESSVLLGYYNEGTSFDVIRIAVNASGASVLDTTPELLNGFYADISFQGGWLFGSFGGVVDPLLPARVGTFAVESYSQCCMYVAPDTANQKVFFLSRWNGNAHLQGHDLRTFLALKSEDIPSDGGTTKNLVRWGANGLAFTSTAGKVYLVQSPILFPPGPPAELTVSQSNEPAIPTAGANLTITVTVTNAGPQGASDLTCTDTLPPGTSFVSAATSQGTWSQDGALIRGQFGEVPAGGQATLTLVIRPPNVGWITNRVSAIANEADPDLRDNISTNRCFVRLPEHPPTVSTISMASLDLAYAPSSGLLYASVPGPDGIAGESIVPMDPDTGVPGTPLLVGEDPRQIVVSSDTQYLYVATQNNYRIQRVALPDGTIGPDFALGTAEESKRVEDLEPLPGHPESIVVVQTLYDFDADVAVYDNGVPRPEVGAVRSDGWPEILELADDAPLAFVHNFGAGGLWSYAIGPNGVTTVKLEESLTPTFTPLDLEWCEGRLYTSLGQVVDPVHWAVAGQIPTIDAPSLVTYDPTVRRLFYLTASEGTGILRAIDPATWAVLDSLTITNIAGVATDLIRYGENGLAFRTTENQIFLIRGTIVPSAPRADLTLICLPPPSPVAAGADFVYRIAVTNLGPGTANNTVALHSFPPTVTYAGATASSGVPLASNGTVRCNFGTLTPGASASLVITARTSYGGPVETHSSVTSDSPDPNATNSTAQATIQAALPLGTDQQGQFALDARDLAHDPFTDRLYASGPGQSVSVVDPHAGIVFASWTVPGTPDLVRLSDDGAFLYCTLNQGLSLVRLRTNDGAVDRQWTFDLGVVDLEPLPGAPRSFVVSRANGPGGVIEVYDDNLARPQRLVDSAGARDLVFGASADTVYSVGQAGTGWPLYRVLSISGTGITANLITEDLPFVLGNLAFGGGALYAGTGEILEPSSGAVVGNFPDAGQESIALPETARQRVYFLNHSDTVWRIQVYDPLSQARLGSLGVPNVAGVPTALVRWGEDGLAFRTSSNQVFILRASMALEQAPADVGVSQTSSPNPLLLGNHVTNTVTVTNVGPNTASNIVVTDRWPSQAPFVEAHASLGTVAATPGQLTWSINTLAPGTSAMLQLTLRPTQGGQFINTVAVASLLADPQLGNNRAAVTTAVSVDLQPNQQVQLSTAVLDLAFDRISGLLFATSANPPGAFSNQVFAVDPLTGLVAPPLLTGNRLSRLVVTDDGSRLYVLANDGQQFLRLALPSGAVELGVPFGENPDGPYSSEFILPVPGQPESLLAAVQKPGVLGGGSGIAIFDGPVARSEQVWGREAVFYASDRLLISEPRIVPSHAARAQLNPLGLVAEPFVRDLVNGHMVASGGLVYTSEGTIIDPKNMMLVRSFGVGGPIAADAELNQVAFVASTPKAYTLHLFDSRNAWEWESLTISNLVRDPVQLVRCGADRLAIRSSSNQLFLVRTSLGPADNDHDGMPDDWERAHGLDASNPLDALGDSDCDGVKNLDEYLRGTDPLAFDGPRFSQPRLSPLGYFECTLHALVGQTFTLQVSSNLLEWTVLRTLTISECPSQVQDSTPSPGTRRFYRLVSP